MKHFRPPKFLGWLRHCTRPLCSAPISPYKAPNKRVHEGQLLM